MTAEQIVSLKALHKTLREKRLAYRVHAVILLGSGWTPQQVAEALLLDEKTVRSYFAHYRNSGEKGLVQLHYQGKAPLLTAAQQKNLPSISTKTPISTARPLLIMSKKRTT